MRMRGNISKINGYESVLPADVQIVTSDGQSIPAHSCVLASSSPVLERMIDRARKGWNTECSIRILGVPSDSVLAFVQLLYSSRMEAEPSVAIEDVMDRHGMRLLAMAHAYRMDWLKRICETSVAARLTQEKVVDALKLAKMCHAPRLYQQCMRLVMKDFVSVQESEGWQFIRRHDSSLESEILHFVEDTEQRNKKWNRQREARELYRQLSEAMDCLHHIFTEGCTDIGPHCVSGSSPDKNRGPCTRFSTCQKLQLLVIHVATCGKKLSPGGCLHCKRMWQLFRLHSSTCDNSHSCRVPLCRQFRVKVQNEEKLDKTWTLLVKKVITAKAMSSLADRKRPERVVTSSPRYTLKSSSRYKGRK